MPGTRPPYSKEFKEKAVQLVGESGKTITEVAKDLGVSSESLRNWVRKHEIEEGKREGLKENEKEELKNLRKENRILREEREILKKAATFFVQETDKNR